MNHKGKKLFQFGFSFRNMSAPSLFSILIISCMFIIYIFETIGLAQPSNKIQTKRIIKINYKMISPKHSFDRMMIEEKKRKKKLIESIIQIGMINQLMYENVYTEENIYDI